VRPVVIENQMDVECRGDLVVDRVQKPQELLTAVATVTFADDAARRHIQCRKQRRRPVSDVVMNPPLGLARPQGQNGHRAVECLNLTLFIDRQEQCANHASQRVLRKIGLELRGERAFSHPDYASEGPNGVVRA
jgi:hypothetical protein